MGNSFSFQGIADNPSSLMIMVGALFVLVGWSSYAIGINGSFMIGLGIILILLGFVLNVIWNRNR